MEPSTTCKQLLRFIERVIYTSRFIPALAKLLEAFQKLFKENTPFKWDKEHKAAFQKVKDVLSYL